MKKLILKPVGGLANRMRAIDSAISLSKKLNRNLEVVWVRDKDLNCSYNKLFKPSKEFRIIESNFNNYLFPTFLPAEEKNLILRLLKSYFWSITKVIMGIKYSIFYEQLFNLYKKYAAMPNKPFGDSEQKFYNEVYNTLTNNSESNTIYITSCWRLNKNEFWYKNLIPIDYLLNKISGLVPQNKEINCGLHIRRTDHKEAIQYSPLDKFKEIIKNQVKKQPNDVFYLSTDDFETEKELLSIFKSKILTYNNKTNDRNTEKGIQDALIDLFCLSKTKKIFGSYGSSFSLVAADISKIQMITIN